MCEVGESGGRVGCGLLMGLELFRPCLVGINSSAVEGDGVG